MGGLTAISLAAERPDLVRSLVVVEASPVGDGEDAEAAARDIGAALRAWPVPFPSPPDAEAFFAERFGGRLAGEAWAAGLEQRADGWWPRFDVEVMVETLLAASAQPNWADWQRIRCPTLVVRAGQGLLEAEVAGAMVAALPTAQLAELPEARHDLHLDRPGEWREILTRFLDSPAPPPRTER